MFSLHPSFELFVQKLSSLSDNIYMVSELNDMLSIFASSSDFEAKVSVPAPGIDKAFKVMLHGKSVADLVAYSGKPLKVELVGNTVVFKGEGRRFSLPLVNQAYVAPSLNTNWTTVIKSMNYNVWKTNCAIARKFVDGSPGNTVSNVCVRDGYLWGTDSRKAIRIPFNGFGKDSVLFPSHLLDAAFKFLDQASAQDICVSYNSHTFLFTCGLAQFKGSLASGQYPVITKLFTRPYNIIEDIDQKEFLSAIRFVSADPLEDAMRLHLEFKPNLLLLRCGSTEAEVECKSSHSGALTVQKRYLFDVVAQMSQSIALGFIDNLSPLYVKDGFNKEVILVPLQA